MMSERPSKYYSQKVTSDDGTFDSKKEYRRWCDLKLLERAGEIRDLQRQVPFTLQPAFSIGGSVVASITYRADFVYLSGATMVIEDAKGYHTKDFLLKWRMLKYQFRDRTDVEMRIV